MNAFVEQLRLAEMAAENIYFAKLDRELIESLHKRMREQENSVKPCDPAPVTTKTILRGVTNE